MYPYTEKEQPKTAPTQLPFNRTHTWIWPPLLLWRPSHFGHTSPLFLSRSVCHTHWKSTNFLTKKTVGKPPSDLDPFSYRSNQQASSKYTKTWAFKTAQPLTFEVFWFSVNKQPNDVNPSGPAGLGSCWDQSCRGLFKSFLPSSPRGAEVSSSLMEKGWRTYTIPPPKNTPLQAGCLQGTTKVSQAYSVETEVQSTLCTSSNTQTQDYKKQTRLT